MEKSKLVLFDSNDINIQLETIRHNNAFILPDGRFYLAKGYTGCNPSHQLESSALEMVRLELGYDIKKEECEHYFQSININYKKVIEAELKGLYYLRSVLVHYYGYALFARQELINSYCDRNRFFDCSLIPNPEYYGRTVTSLQIGTLKELFNINDDKTLCLNFMNKSSEDIFQKVLNHNKCHSSWHR